MAMSMMPLLIHSEAVPKKVRDALKAAELAPPATRHAELEVAARMLYGEVGISCRDIRDLVGLGPKAECS